MNPASRPAESCGSTLSRDEARRVYDRIGARQDTQAFHEALVGGCRPLDLLSWIPLESWVIRHRAHLAPFGVPSEALVAERRSIVVA